MSGRPAPSRQAPRRRAIAPRPDPDVGSALFRALVRRAGLPAPVPELRFHAARKWRFDWAWPAHRLALEVEGGVFTGGRHTRPTGFLRDVEKYNAAAALGWRVLRCTPDQLATLATVDLIARALAAESGVPKPQAPSSHPPTPVVDDEP